MTEKGERFLSRKRNTELRVIELNFPDGTVIAFTDFCLNILKEEKWWKIRRAIEDDLRELTYNPFGERSVDQLLREASANHNIEKVSRIKVLRTVNRAGRNFQDLFPHLPIAIKGTGEFKQDNDKAKANQENLLRQFYTMRRLFLKWSLLPENIQEIIRPIAVYGVISYLDIKKGLQQWLFMELVEGKRMGVVGSYKIDGSHKGFNTDHHPNLYRLVKDNLSEGSINLWGPYCDFTLLERVFCRYGINLINLEGRDILWFDDEKGNRYYRLIDMRSHNFQDNKINK